MDHGVSVEINSVEESVHQRMPLGYTQMNISFVQIGFVRYYKCIHVLLKW